jgi:hypothetical protein
MTERRPLTLDEPLLDAYAVAASRENAARARSAS